MSGEGISHLAAHLLRIRCCDRNTTGNTKICDTYHYIKLNSDLLELTLKFGLFNLQSETITL